MPAPDLLLILERLNNAYPEKQLAKDNLKLYIEQLSDIPISLLDQAVTRHIQTSPWFPHISDLRQLAQQLSGNGYSSSLQSAGVDYLDFEALQLQTNFYHRGRFDLHAWEKLIRQFDNLGRCYRAEELRRKVQHIQESQASVDMGEEYPPQTDRQRYTQWENGS